MLDSDMIFQTFGKGQGCFELISHQKKEIERLMTQLYCVAWSFPKGSLKFVFTVHLISGVREGKPSHV